MDEKYNASLKNVTLGKLLQYNKRLLKESCH